ncbi:MAG: cytochrome c-type biogenesis protein CcmH [candidate division NC10 bacterium]|nr:cytochrome c-type biogenesis protein CcmH [candidate division NC10 bacterium]
MGSQVRGAGSLAGAPGRRHGRWPGFALVWALVWIGLVIPGVAPAASGSPNPDLEDQVREIASGLRCVVCQNLSVADSPSDLAKEMRNLVRELVQQGKSREEIQAYFVSRYGEFVLLSPPKRGFNLLVWGLPFLAIVVGAWGVYLVARGWTLRREEAEPAVDPAYAERVRRDLREREGPAGP